MKPYGVDRKDHSRCCPGHDKYPKRSSWAYKNSNRKTLNQANKSAKTSIRQRVKRFIDDLLGIEPEFVGVDPAAEGADHSCEVTMDGEKNITKIRRV